METFPVMFGRPQKPCLWTTGDSQERRDSSESSQSSPKSVQWFDLATNSSASPTKHRFGHRPSGSFSSTTSDDSVSSTTSSSSSDKPVRAKIRTLPRRTKPSLRRCSSPTTCNLRELWKQQSEDQRKQSEENLRGCYESQTLAYLNDAIHF